MLFSHRFGYKPIKQVIQIDNMDSELRISLWNVLSIFLFNDMNKCTFIYNMPDHNRLLIDMLWFKFYKRPIDEIGDHWPTVYACIKKWYFNAGWNEVYDFLEFIADSLQNERGQVFCSFINTVLKSELSGYRFVDLQLVRITDESEIEAVEQAVSNQTPCKGARIHLQSALTKLGDRANPDYRNSIKESISAVEAIAQAITGDSKASLGKALDMMERNQAAKLHGSLKAGYDKIYGYTSDAQGIRHALLDECDLDFEDAYYMLVSCSAFVNYLVAKTQKAQIKLK